MESVSAYEITRQDRLITDGAGPGGELLILSWHATAARAPQREISPKPEIYHLQTQPDTLLITQLRWTTISSSPEGAKMEDNSKMNLQRALRTAALRGTGIAWGPGLTLEALLL